MDAHLRSPLSPVLMTTRASLPESAATPSLAAASRSRFHAKTGKSPLPLPSSASSSSTPSTSCVGSPINFLKSNQQQQHARSSAVVAVTPLHKPRPATAVGHTSTSATPSPSTSSSAVVHALITTHTEDARVNDASSHSLQLQRRSPSLRPATAAPSLASHSDPVVEIRDRHVQRCAGCGAYAELCMACFSQLKHQDGAAYKKQIARSVEMLFERATARAFTKMAHVILLWIFGTWKRETTQQKRRRALATRVLANRHMQRLWLAWRTFIHERRVVGAMLYAQQQQHETRGKTREIAQLHGDVFATRGAAQLHDELHRDALAQLQQALETQQHRLHAKNQELLTLRHELHAARDRIARLEQQSVDPKELARLRSENVDAKKMVCQLANSMLQSLETELEVLTTSEGRQNLNGVLSKDVVQLLDKPECQSFVNPLVELTALSSSGSDSQGQGTQGPVALASQDAPADRADRILLQWVNFLLQRQQTQMPEWIAASRVLNFHVSFSDGRAWTLLTKTLHTAMCKTRLKRLPGVATSTPNAKHEAGSMLRENGEDLTEIAMERYVDYVKREDAPSKRLALVLQTLAPALWMPVGLLHASDVVAGDAELNFATLAYLFCTASPCLDDAHDALCLDLKSQLTSAKTKWRELRDAAAVGVGVGATQTTTVGMTAGHSSGVLVDAALLPKIKLALAQLLELKKRLHAEDAKARDGHVMWWKSARIVLRKCFVSYARLARGQAGVLAKLEAVPDENTAFRTLPKTLRLTDLELAGEDFAWELKLLQTFLGTVYCDLARIYRGYATRGDPNTEWMSVGDVVELLTECRVVDGVHLTAQDAQSIVRRLDPKLTIGTISNARSVTPTEFLEVLVRTARRKYAGEHHRVTLSEAFCLLIDNFILPFAFRADADFFRSQMDDPTIRRLLLKCSDELRELYAQYAVDDARRRAARKRPRVTAITFRQCLLDRNVLDAVFTSEKVLSIVQRIARTSKKETDESHHHPHSQPIAAMPEDDELTFDAFEEAMVVTACYKFPDPYTSLESRVDKFLSVYVRGLGGSGKAAALAAAER